MLGVSETATDEEVKKAYRDLVRKYHPDKYVDNPLADVAAEKMKEINAAYEQVQKMRKAGNGAYSGNYGYNQSYNQSYNRGYYNGGYNQGYGGSYNSSYGGQSRFADIRRLISQNRIAEADELLDGVPDYNKNAEWYFLKGSIYYKRGWLGEAARCYQRAYQMEPSNSEYAAAYQRVSYQQQYGSSPGGVNVSSAGCDCCDLCAGYMCLDCLCRHGC